MNSKVMGFLEHLDEMRHRIIVALIALAIASFIAYFFSFQILKILMRPLPAKLPDGTIVKFYYLSVMDAFMARVKIAIFGGFLVSSPIVFYEMLAFLSPALRENEKKWMYPVLGSLVALFMTGVAICYFFVIPPAFRWLVSQGGDVLHPMLTVSEYVRFVSLFLLAFGVAFETPLVVLFLIRLGIVKRETLREQWRFVYVGCFVVAALSTPDWSPLPMLILGFSLVVLFELSMFVARFIEPRRQRVAETSAIATTAD